MTMPTQSRSTVVFPMIIFDEVRYSISLVYTNYCAHTINFPHQEIQEHESFSTLVDRKWREYGAVLQR